MSFYMVDFSWIQSLIFLYLIFNFETNLIFQIKTIIDTIVL